ncbi:MAG: hypothetical protein ACLUWN_02425 [Clostridia bacterium]|jgi:hypothetical protein
MEKEILEKHLEINNLLIEVSDLLVNKFFDSDSDEMLDEKIEVLEKLKEGIPPANIPNYYKILELYPKNNEEIWD